MQYIAIKMPPELGWQAAANAYSFDRYWKWLGELEQAPFMQTEVLVSDNLVCALAIREDTVLTGSFLWPDILRVHASSDASAVDLCKLVAFEESLLKRIRPVINCIADIYMPYLEEFCEPNKLGWFCEEQLAVKPVNEFPNVLFTIGLTGTSLNKFKAAFKILPTCLNIYGDDKLAHTIEGTKQFSFKPEDFRKLDAIVCRPGIGILTDAISYGVPVLMLYDEGNIEMAHNALRAEHLGMGRAINLDHIERLAETLFELFADKQKYNYAQVAPINGADTCATFILNRLIA